MRCRRSQEDKTGSGRTSQRESFIPSLPQVIKLIPCLRSHAGLTRGTTDLAVCAPGEENCNRKTPQLVRYDGYKHLQEPLDEIIQCIGPRGLPMNESDEDAIWAYPGKARGKKNT